MIAAKNRYNRIVQVGQWQRSQKHFKDALDMVHSGQLGNIRTTKVWCYQGWMRPQPIVPNSAVPAGVDYKTWIGPAPMRDFNASRFHFHFRWFWDYAGGLMTDWGVHLLDYAIQGMKAGNPKSVSALGGKFAYPELAEETPDTLTTLYEFDNFNLVWDSAMGIDNGSYGRDHGIAFIGNNGTLILDRGGWEVIEERQAKNKVAIALHKSEDNGVNLHWLNFTEAIRNNTPGSLHCPIEEGAHIATIAQMGNIAYRSGKKVNWDATKNLFTDDAINKEYFTKAYHNGYSLPKV
jgi:predicted dehydrogenase